MSYNVEVNDSARLYRPNMLNDYIGNKGMKRSILAMFTEEVLPQVLLFTGSAGTGKTTMGRIIAKYYRCENRDLGEEACNECYSCQNFNEFIRTGTNEIIAEFEEVDATEGGNKENIDRIIEEATKYTSQEKYRVYIFDEAHAINQVAQNRLLKFLEEPPERTLIILCTTNPEKMLDTIVSRCRKKFVVQKPTLDELMGLLKMICEDKGIEYDERALALISTKNDLAQRATLNKFDDILSEYKRVRYVDVVEAMQHVSDEFLIKFYKILLGEFIDTRAYLQLVWKIKTELGVSKFIHELISFTIRGIYAVNGINVVGLGEEEKKMYIGLFSKLNVVEIASLLKYIISMEKYKDAEPYLIQLAFIGIRNQRMSSNAHTLSRQEGDELGTQQLIPPALVSAEQERNITNSNYQEHVTPTEQTFRDFVEDKTQSISSATSLAALLGSSVVIQPKSEE